MTQSMAPPLDNNNTIKDEPIKEEKIVKEK